MNSILDLALAALGWSGAAVVLFAYVLVSNGKVTGNSLRYQALSMLGSVMLMANCAASGAWPSAITNLVFLFVGINIVLTTKRSYMAQLIRHQLSKLTRQFRRRKIAQSATTDLELVAGI